MISLDVNVLIEAFEDRPNKRRAQRVLFGRDVVLSDWTMAELASALAGQVREREITREARDQVTANIDAWAATVRRVEVQARDVTDAEAVLRTSVHALRTPDAMQLVVARRLGAALATFDSKLANIAEILGLAVVRP